MLNRLMRFHLATFGTLQSLCIVLLIISVFVTGHFLGGKGEFWLWQIGGCLVGVKSMLITYRLRILGPHPHSSTHGHPTV